MVLFEKLGKCLTFILCIFCPPIHAVMFSEYDEKRLQKWCLGFVVGFLMGHLYYIYFLKEIDILSDSLFIISLILSVLLASTLLSKDLNVTVLLGIGNALTTQGQCISALLLPMYCGKSGRGVLKAIVLTYVLAGPITNMGYNAKEVVRVFACTTQLSYNLSKTKYALMYRPIRKALLNMKSEIDDIKDSLRCVRDVVAPIEQEIEGTEYMQQMQTENDDIRNIFSRTNNSDCENNRKITKVDYGPRENLTYNKIYLNKLECRCENHLARGVSTCFDAFLIAYSQCHEGLPASARVTCWPLMPIEVCNIKRIIGPDICSYKHQIDPGLEEGYSYLKLAESKLIQNLNDIKMQYKVTYEKELRDIQDAKETGDRVLQEFQEKIIIMRSVITVVNIFLALLFLRIAVAAQNYHDLYLSSIDYDNVYVTGYFKEIDKRRRSKNKFSLLPFKKMERYRYIDVLSLSYIPLERNKLLTQILKVMLEAVTATTFVMLDRLFFEALDVVRLHAIEETSPFGMQDLDIKVEGSGALAFMIRKMLFELHSNTYKKAVSNKICLPRPRAIAPIFYFKIYGGYLWILLLLYFNPYTLRLRRLICGYFYPRREKQRILHLYNDILKKRLKMQKTLRRKAVQAVRAHYLSGENLLSLRIKFPQVLGWLNALPIARMKCLICAETEPRYNGRKYHAVGTSWFSCVNTRCPFVYCAECWREVGARCLACDPSLAELSDVDSLSDDYPPRY